MMRPNGACSESGTQNMHVGNGAIINASRRARAARTHLIDHGDDVRLALPLLRIAFGDGVALLDIAVNEPRYVQRGFFRHQTLRMYSLLTSFILHRRSREVNARQSLPLLLGQDHVLRVAVAEGPILARILDEVDRHVFRPQPRLLAQVFDHALEESLLFFPAASCR